MWPGANQGQVLPSTKREDIAANGNHCCRHPRKEATNVIRSVRKVGDPFARSSHHNTYSNKVHSNTQNVHTRFFNVLYRKSSNSRSGPCHEMKSGHTLCTYSIIDTAIVCFVLSLLNGCATASADFHFPDTKQGQFAQDLTRFHISWPNKVNHLGEFISKDLHLKHGIGRSRRSINDDISDSVVATGATSRNASLETLASIARSGLVHRYRIPINSEKDVVVEISHTDLLLSPSALVERKISKFKNVSDSVFSTLVNHHGCHFGGRVQGERDSKVALSTCDGLRGFLQIGNEEYLIEPVKGTNISRDSGQPHLVYRRSALPDHQDFLSSTRQREPACGVKEKYDRAVSQRERWEKHRKSVSKRKSVKREASSHNRKKRSISIEKHVETLVVVDTDMVNYYENEDIETYVLTVMNMVATLFHDASIGNAVNIVIVRIILLQDPDEELQITHHADKTLKSFCKWQKNINFKDDDHPNHHDVAVLLTRRNICFRNNEPCSTLGLAQVSGLCQPHRTCSINEDTGLSLAWTVSHELGHNFGMKHDNQHSDCVSDPDIQYVMAPTLTWDKTPSSWSNCSRTAITKFLDRNWGYCLDDPPGHHDFKYPELPAGTMYDADHQCRLLYGEGAERCNGIEILENICTTLWCRVNNKCSTKLQAAAVGTICGIDKWCFAGQCVDIGERPQAIDGQWSEWAEWTDCTRTCGAGVSVSQRHCNHPPPSNGGKYCTGERKRYRICNTDNCPEDGSSFRAQQCSEFNEIPYKATHYEWEAILTPETPCQLHCKPKDFFFSVMLKDIVTDGTPCVIGSRHMCISGRCRHVGCDWIIDSSAIEDRCGVCFGDGSTCETIKEQFNETKIQGYVEATVIPIGARNIRVEEVAEASNFLALKNNAGEYYLNGHWFIQWSGDYEVAGTVIHYKRVGNKEKFVAPGPLKEALHIMLLMQTHNPGVEFEYTVPKENATNNKKLEFSWDYMDWSHCTVSCGGGTQRSAVVCKEQEAGLVDEVYCDQITKPDDQMRACNVHLCPARWWTGPWQHCSVTCDIGIHQRTVICIRSLGSDEQIALEDLACEGLDKPVEIEPCHHKDPCPIFGVWKVEEWSNCSKSCNSGLQSRNVTCVGGSCDNKKPNVSQSCNEHKCSVNLEKEILNLEEGGAEGGNEFLPSDFNTTLSSLSNITSINNNMLPLDDKNILISDSSSVLPTDGINIYNNVNIESSHLHKHRHHHQHHNLHSDSSIPTNMTSNAVPHDKPQRKLDSLEMPSQEGKVAEGGENTQNTPLTELAEQAGDSSVIWQTLEWSICSSQCGQGVRTRDVLCIQVKTGQKVGNNHCDAVKKPTAIVECFESICLEWQIGDWAECSATCGYATQFRQVFCTSPEYCDVSQKPESTRICKDLRPCITWVYGDWSKCTKSCGLGSQERLVQCVNLTSQQLSPGCLTHVKPDERQDCNEDECPTDDNAALTISCESNEMSFNVCQMLKKVGLCHKQYVLAKCCRTCHHDTRPKPDVQRLTRR